MATEGMLGPQWLPLEQALSQMSKQNLQSVFLIHLYQIYLNWTRSEHHAHFRATPQSHLKMILVNDQILDHDRIKPLSVVVLLDIINSRQDRNVQALWEAYLFATPLTTSIARFPEGNLMYLESRTFTIAEFMCYNKRWINQHEKDEKLSYVSPLFPASRMQCQFISPW